MILVINVIQIVLACTKTWNAGTSERRDTKDRNTNLLKPETHEKLMN